MWAMLWAGRLGLAPTLPYTLQSPATLDYSRTYDTILAPRLCALALRSAVAWSTVVASDPPSRSRLQYTPRQDTYCTWIITWIRTFVQYSHTRHLVQPHGNRQDAVITPQRSLYRHAEAYSCTHGYSVAAKRSACPFFIFACRPMPLFVSMSSIRRKTRSSYPSCSSASAYCERFI